jgi:hypothetical protein
MKEAAAQQPSEQAAQEVAKPEPQKATTAARSGSPNEAHKRLLERSEADRRIVLAKVIKEDLKDFNDESCGGVTQTFYQGSGSYKGSHTEIWNAQCNNGKSYVLLIQADARGSASVMSCDMLKFVGVNGQCWVKYSD